MFNVCILCINQQLCRQILVLTILSKKMKGGQRPIQTVWVKITGLHQTISNTTSKCTYDLKVDIYLYT